MNADDFRKLRLYNASAHKVLQSYQSSLKKIFTHFVGFKKASVEKRSRMFLDEWYKLLSEAQMFDERFAKREARVCFCWSRMRVVDDLRHRDLFCSIGFMGTSDLV